MPGGAAATAGTRSNSCLSLLFTLASVLVVLVSFIFANNLLFLILAAMLATFGKVRRRALMAGK